MVLETPKSSNVARLIHENDRLTVVFKSRDCYEYYGVSEELFKEAFHVDSIGRWASARIKGKFPCRRIK